jgi:AraC-like DNA-binding protein
MNETGASFDDVSGFHRFLPVSRHDRDWGLYVSGGGVELATPASTLPYQPYPSEYTYEWSTGRTLVDEFGLLYFNSGTSWSVETEDTKGQLVIQPGSVLLLFPGVWHRYLPIFDGTADRASSLWCKFGGDFADRWQQRGLISPATPLLDIGDNTAVEMHFRRLHSYIRSGESFSLQQSLAAAFLELLASVNAAARMAVGPSLPVDVIRQAKIILEDLTLPDATPRHVAEMLKVPYNQFRHSFKLATGLSPHKYHLQAVIQRAKELLQGSGLSIKEISVALRFPDQYYFARAFKRKTGLSPSEWRSRSRETPVGPTE